MHPMLTIAVRAARRAGSIITPRFAQRQLAERALEARERFRDAGGPGGGRKRSSRSCARRTPTTAFSPRNREDDRRGRVPLVIDPLDGTTNFIHGFPQYCVSIAVEHRGALAHGVVYDPVKNELFTASKAAAGLPHDRRIRVFEMHGA